MHRLGQAPTQGTSLLPLAFKTAGVVAAIELPVSMIYRTDPPTKVWQRMLIAGGMGFAAVLIAGAIGRRVE